MCKILVTGAAGFIGYHITKRLCRLGHSVTGVDNLVHYYPVELKIARLQDLGFTPDEVRKEQSTESTDYPDLKFMILDITDRQKTLTLFKKENFDYVIHLAAQAGVRASLTDPDKYIQSNIEGWLSILEASRHHPVKHLIFASSSSVYGNNKKLPFSETDRVDEPVSLYAATKKSGELMAYTYAHLFQIPITALRFFTVYGPWGRPDMAYYKFVTAIHNGSTIDVYNQGNLYRDFTYIDDVVDGVTKLLEKRPESIPPYRVLNIGHSSPVKLMEFITIIEQLLQKKANIQFLPMQPGDVHKTYADVEALDRLVGFRPKISLRAGLANFVDWYRAYYEQDNLEQMPGHDG